MDAVKTEAIHFELLQRVLQMHDALSSDTLIVVEDEQNVPRTRARKRRRTVPRVDFRGGAGIDIPGIRRLPDAPQGSSIARRRKRTRRAEESDLSDSSDGDDGGGSGFDPRMPLFARDLSTLRARFPGASVLPGPYYLNYYYRWSLYSRIVSLGLSLRLDIRVVELDEHFRRRSPCVFGGRFVGLHPQRRDKGINRQCRCCCAFHRNGACRANPRAEVGAPSSRERRWFASLHRVLHHITFPRLHVWFRSSRRITSTRRIGSFPFVARDALVAEQMVVPSVDRVGCARSARVWPCRV